jgi:hypothetical protein
MATVEQALPVAVSTAPGRSARIWKTIDRWVVPVFTATSCCRSR